MPVDPLGILKKDNADSTSQVVNDPLNLLKKKSGINIGGTPSSTGLNTGEADLIPQSSNPFLHATKQTGIISNEQISKSFQQNQNHNGNPTESTANNHLQQLGYNLQTAQPQIQKYNTNLQTAIAKTASARLKAQGKPVTDKNINAEVEQTKTDINVGKLGVNTEPDGTLSLGTGAGFWDGMAQNVSNQLHNVKYLAPLVYAHIKGDGAMLSQLAEQMSAEKEYINNHPYKALGDLFNQNPLELLTDAATTKDTGEQQLSYNTTSAGIGQQVAGIGTTLLPLAIPGVGEGNEAATLLGKIAQNYPRMIAGAAQTYSNDVPEKFLQLYQENKDNGMDAGSAAKKSASDAELQSILPAVTGGALFSGAFGGNPVAEKTFGDAVVGALKNGGKFSAIMGAQQGADDLIKHWQGYKTDAGNDIADAMKSGFLQTVAMEMLPHALSLPKHLQSQLYNYATNNIAKPVLDTYLQNMPDGAKISSNIASFKNVADQLKPYVDDSHLPIVGGLTSKINSVKEDIANLEVQKKTMPEALHPAVDEKISNLQKQAQNLNGRIEEAQKTDTPTDVERNDITGEKVKDINNENQNSEVINEKGNTNAQSTSQSSNETGTAKENVGEVVQPQQNKINAVKNDNGTITIKNNSAEIVANNEEHAQRIAKKIGGELNYISDTKSNSGKSTTENNNTTAREPISLKEVLDTHENSDNNTFNDLVDNVEQFSTNSGNDKMLAAVDKYRREQENDNSLKGRGDMDAAESDFQKALNKQIEAEINPSSTVSNVVLKDLKPLAESVGKYKTAKEFEDAHTQSDLLDLSNPQQHRFGRIFSDSGEGMQDVVDINNSYGKGKHSTLDDYKEANVPRISDPEKTVTVYRSAHDAANKIELGDYVSFSKDYAESHNRGKLIKMQVPAKDVIWQGNDFNEWIYSPKEIRDKYTDLQDFYNKNKPTEPIQSKVVDNPLKDVEVYHGTPHGFDKFDISKLGSGEGAQAFGHGLYFTNDKVIADGYANKLSSKKNFWQHLMDGKDISMSKEDFDFVNKELDALGFDGAKAENENLGNIKVDGKDEYAPQVLDAMSVLFGKNAKSELEGYDLTTKEIDRLMEIKKKISNPKLYTATLKGGDYIDWHNPLSESQKKKLGDINTDGTGKEIYEELSKKLGSDKKASDYLESKGIDGIIYKSEKGTGGKSGEGRNYVVFNDKNVSITEINGEKQAKSESLLKEQPTEPIQSNVETNKASTVSEPLSSEPKPTSNEGIVDKTDATISKIDNGEIVVNSKDDYRIQKQDENKYRIASTDKNYPTITTDKEGLTNFLKEKNNDFSFIKELTDKQLEKRLDIVHEQQDKLSKEIQENSGTKNYKQRAVEQLHNQETAIINERELRIEPKINLPINTDNNGGGDVWTAVRKEKLLQIEGVKKIFEKETGKKWTEIQQAALEGVQKEFPNKSLYEAVKAKTEQLALRYDNGEDYNPTSKDIAVIQEFKRQTQRRISESKEALNSTNNIERLATVAEVDGYNNDLQNSAKALFTREAGTAFGYRQSESRYDENYGLQIRRMQLMKANDGEALSKADENWVNDKWQQEKEIIQKENQAREDSLKEEFNKKLTDLKAEYDKKISSKIGEKTKQTQREKTLSQKGKEIADKIRQLKTEKNTLKTDFTLGTWDLAIEGIAKLVEAGSTIAEAIQKLIDEKQIGFKSDRERTDFEDKLSLSIAPKIEREPILDSIKKLAQNTNDITTEMVDNNLIKNFVQSYLGEVPISGLLDKATKDLQEILPEIDKTRLSEAYLKKGDFRQDTQRDIRDGLNKAKQQLIRISKEEYRAKTKNDKLQQDRLVEQKNNVSKKIKEYSRRLSEKDFNTDYEPITLEKSDAELIKLNKQKSEIEAEFRKKQEEIQKKRKGTGEQIADLARNAYVSALIGSPKTFFKVGGMALMRPLSEGVTKLTTGKLFDLFFPNISEAALRGGESSSWRSVEKGFQAYFRQVGETKLNDKYETANASYEDAAKKYVIAEKNGASESELRNLKDDVNKKLLKVSGSFIYKFIGGSSLKDALESLVNRTNEVEKQFKAVHSESIKGGNWLDKTNYILGFVGRSHSALKTFSGRFSFAAGFMARLEGAVKDGVDINGDRILEIAHESYLDWERGKYQQDNYVSDKWNQLVKAIDQKLSAHPEWDRFNKATRQLFKSEVAITRVPVNILHEAVMEYTLGAFRGINMALKEYRKAKGIALDEGFGKDEQAAFKDRISDIVSNMDEKQAATIARAFRKGSLGIGLYAFFSIAGIMKFGTFPHMYQQKTKDDSQLKPDELNADQIQIGDTKLGEIPSAMISHIPALWPALMGLGMSYQYNHDINKPRKPLSPSSAVWDALYTHLGIIQSGIPQSKIINPLEIATGGKKAFEKRLNDFGLVTEKDGYDGKDVNNDEVYKTLKEDKIPLSVPDKGSIHHEDGSNLTERELSIFTQKQNKLFHDSFLNVMNNGVYLNKDGKVTISENSAATDNDFNLKTKKYKDLTYEEKRTVVKELLSSATKNIKKEMFTPKNTDNGN